MLFRSKIKGNNYGKAKVIAVKEGDFMYNKISTEFFVNVFKINQKEFKINNINQLNEIEVDPDTKYFLSCNNVKEGARITYIIKSQKTDEESGKNIVCTINNNILIDKIHIHKITFTNYHKKIKHLKPILFYLYFNFYTTIIIKN